ncbi:hypothetical protein KEM55_002361, partial [Ascosphaera atra]
GEKEDKPSENAPTYRVNIEYQKSLTVSDLLEDLRRTTPNSEYAVNKEEIIQALNIVLKDHAKNSDELFTLGKNQGGNKIYSKSDSATSQDLGDGLSAVRGFYTSVRPATDRLLLNVNVSNGAFYKSKPLNELFMSDFNGFDGFTATNMKFVNNFISKVKVMTTHLPERRNEKGQVIPRFKTIIGFATKDDGKSEKMPPKVLEYAAGPRDVSFWFEESAENAKDGRPAPPAYRTVAEHFRMTYRINVDPDLPVLNVGTKEKPSYLPAEVCKIAKGQAWKRLLTAAQTDGMLKFAGRPPFENARAIVEEGFKTVGMDPEINPTLKEFGVEFGKNLLTVEGRVLPAPKVLYGKNTQADTQRAPGQWNLKDAKFNIPGRHLKEWSILLITTQGYDTSRGVGGPDNLMKGISNGLHATGLKCDEPILRNQVRVQNNNYDNTLDTQIAIMAAKSKFLVTIVPSKDPALYAQIKQLCDVKYGIQNICVVAQTIAGIARKGGAMGMAQYWANVSMKFNMKLGGVNHIVDEMRNNIIAEGKTMLLGLDVTHPSPGSSESTPSIAAMVGSIDKNLAQWPATLSMQAKAKQEDITDLKDMLRRQLGLWIKLGKNQAYPENIIVYRDGVSEGQFDKVLKDELPQLRQACREVYNAKDQQKGLPRFTVMVVTKRHQTRFYPADVKDADKKSNAFPGTTVDRGITEAQRWTFYQQGHAALQGTARSAKYDVLVDEVFKHRYAKTVPPPYSNLQDVVESFNLSLCYIYGRATKAVSLCTPAKYADMACERARCYLSYLFSGSQPPPANLAAHLAGVTPHGNIKDTMFYL